MSFHDDDEGEFHPGAMWIAFVVALILTGLMVLAASCGAEIERMTPPTIPTENKSNG